MPDPIPGAVIVIAKTPQAGKVKTRLSPPLTPDEACEVAWACLLDTLSMVAAVPAARHIVLLDGPPGRWIPPSFEVIAQRGKGLAERLANGFVDVADSAVLVAMDTPHAPSDLVAGALGDLRDGYDAVFGPASDGGYWMIGLRAGIDAAAVFCDVPMSTDHTGLDQMLRLQTLSLVITTVPEQRDIDCMADLVDIAGSPRAGRLGALSFLQVPKQDVLSDPPAGILD